MPVGMLQRAAGMRVPRALAVNAPTLLAAASRPPARALQQLTNVPYSLQPAWQGLPSGEMPLATLLGMCGGLSGLSSGGFGGMSGLPMAMGMGGLPLPLLSPAAGGGSLPMGMGMAGLPTGYLPMGMGSMNSGMSGLPLGMGGVSGGTGSGSGLAQGLGGSGSTAEEAAAAALAAMGQEQQVGSARASGYSCVGLCMQARSVPDHPQ
jgi:hypothetical protein